MFKSVLSKLVVALALTQSSTGAHSIVNRGHYKRGMNPGFMVRLEQKSVNGLKFAFQDFFPHFIERDMNLPASFEFDIGMGDVMGGIFQRTVTWTEINYVNAVWDIVGIKLDFIADEEGLGQKIKIDFPAMKQWEVSAYQEVSDDFLDIGTG